MSGLASFAGRVAAHARTGAATAARSGAAWARPSSALIVPVLDAEPAVAAWLRQERVDFDGAPLHVTVMFPFLPARSVGAAVEDELAALAHGTEPFGFALVRLGRFPGVYYLAPEPAAPFAEMTKRIQRRWPTCQPYDGAYAQVVPHMTVAFGDHPPADLASLERALPIASRARELWLIEQTLRGWRMRRRIALGPASPSPN